MWKAWWLIEIQNSNTHRPSISMSFLIGKVHETVRGLYVRHTLINSRVPINVPVRFTILLWNVVLTPTHLGWYWILPRNYTNYIRLTASFNATGPFQMELFVEHYDVIKWKHFPCYWPFVRGIHRSPVNSPHKGQWRGALMFPWSVPWIKKSE